MKSSEIKATTQNLLEINDVIKQLDESMRETALRVLVPLYFPTANVPEKKVTESSPAYKKGADKAEPDNSDLGEFLQSFEQGKPADSVLLLVSWLYSHYGAYPITAKEIQELGDSCGLILPQRPDNTMRQAKNDGKSLFTQQGKGWRLTVSGEMYIKSTYNVKKGNATLPKG